MGKVLTLEQFEGDLSVVIADLEALAEKAPAEEWAKKLEGPLTSLTVMIEDLSNALDER